MGWAGWGADVALLGRVKDTHGGMLDDFVRLLSSRLFCNEEFDQGWGWNPKIRPIPAPPALPPSLCHTWGSLTHFDTDRLIRPCARSGTFSTSPS